MKINCIWEHNGNDTLLYAESFIGAYARGESLDVAVSKMPDEIKTYLQRLGADIPESMEIVIAQERTSELNIRPTSEYASQIIE